MFSGELMRCYQCGFSQKSHPRIESGWYKVVADGKLSHICPSCTGIVGKGAHRCPNCKLYYNWHYQACPHCLTSN